MSRQGDRVSSKADLETEEDLHKGDQGSEDDERARPSTSRRAHGSYSQRPISTPTRYRRRQLSYDDDSDSSSVREEEARMLAGQAQDLSQVPDIDLDSLKIKFAELQKQLKKATLLKPKQPEKYDGSSKPSEMENWTHSVEMYLTAKDMLISPAAIDYVATLLIGPAATWWRHHKEAVRRNEEYPIKTWRQFKKMIAKFFRPENSERINLEKLQRVTQLGSVRNYNQAYQSIMVELPDMAERERIFFYLIGLKTTVRLHVELRYPRSLRAGNGGCRDSRLYNQPCRPIQPRRIRVRQQPTSQRQREAVGQPPS